MIVHKTKPLRGPVGSVMQPAWQEGHVVDSGGIPFADGTTQTTALPATLQTLAEKAAGVVPINTGYLPGWVPRYMTAAQLADWLAGTGAVDSSTAFAAAHKMGGVIIPSGKYKATNVAISSNDCTMMGFGAANTTITVGANNSVIFNVTGQRFKVSGIAFVGDGTSNSGANGVAILLTNAGGHVNQDCSFTNFGFGAVSGTAGSALKGPQNIRPYCRGTAAGGNEFYLGGIWTDTLIEDVDAQSAVANRVLLLYDNSTTGWQGLIVRGGVANGYQQQQFATTDEHWDGTNRVWTALFERIRCIGSNWSGIKCKTSRNVKIAFCTFDGCGLAQEDQVNGLYGDVLVNSLGKVEIVDNTFRNSGSAAIHCNAVQVSLYPGANPGGLSEDNWIVDRNEIDTTGVVFPAQGFGVVVSNGWKGMLVGKNTMRGIANRGIYVLTTAASPFWDLGLFSNTITDSPAAIGIDVSFGQSLRMDGNLVQNCGATGVMVTSVPEVYIGPTDAVLDPAVGAGRGYYIKTVQNLDFKARAGNSTYPAWVALTAYTVGQRIFNGANVYECVVGGNSGSGAGPVATSGADTSDGTVTWYFVGKYQLMPYALRLDGTQGRVDADFDPTGCTTGPIEAIVAGTGGVTIRFRVSIQTTAAGPTNSPAIPLPDLTAWMLEMLAVGQAAAVPDRAAFHQVGLFYRNGGNTTLQGAVTSVVAIKSNAAWAAVPAASSTNVIPAQLTGAAATTINWNLDITLRGMP